MAQTSLRPPPILQPRPKAVSTASSNAIAASSLKTPHAARTAQGRQPTPVLANEAADLSDKATIAFVRRILCPQTLHTEARPIDELLPPLTSSNTIDLQLYAILAIIIKDTVHPWYGKITPDQTFVEEVIKIVAHCTRALESRLRTIDVEALILDELPDIIERHIYAYRVSQDYSQVSSFSNDPRVIYYHLNPHPAVIPVPDPTKTTHSSDQPQNEGQYRQLLVQGALAILLPTEDLENACLRTLVADVIAESILGNAIGKIAEGRFIWTSITKLLTAIDAKVQPQATEEAIKEGTRSRLEQFGLLEKDNQSATKVGPRRPSWLSRMFWRSLQVVYLAIMSIRFVLIGIAMTRSQPPRSSTSPKQPASQRGSPLTAQLPQQNGWHPAPLLSYRIFALSSTLLDLPVRAPWLSGTLALVQHHLIDGPVGLFRIGATDRILDRYIHSTLTNALPPAVLLPQGLLLLRQTLFPGNSLPRSPSQPPPPASAPASPNPDPDRNADSAPAESNSDSDIDATKRECAHTILALLPSALRHHLLGPDEAAQLAELEAELDIWGEQAITKGMLYRLMECVVVRVFPELGSCGVRELMEGRVG